MPATVNDRSGWNAAVDALEEMAKAMGEKADAAKSPNRFDPATMEEADAATSGWVLAQAAKLLREQTPDVVRCAGLTISALQSAHATRQEEWCPDQKPDLSFRGNEMAGEVGEACNVIEKLERERHGWRGSRATINDLGDELADTIHTAILCAITAGIDLEPRVFGKFNATSEKNGLATRLVSLSPWRRITKADCEVATIQTFSTITLRNSHPSWVRDADGRTYEALWTVHDKGVGYWWDIEGESPVDPVEIYPHPLTRMSEAEEPIHCDICAGTIRIGDICATDIELGMVHAVCIDGSPTVNLETGEQVEGPIPTYQYEGDR